MVEKPTATPAADDAQQGSGTTDTQGAGREPYPGHDNDMMDVVREFDKAHTMETYRQEWNRQHPDYAYPDAKAFSNGLRDTYLRLGARPDIVDEMIKERESFGMP